MTRISDKPLAFQALQQRRRERSIPKKPIGGGQWFWGGQQQLNASPEWLAQSQKTYWNSSLFDGATHTRCTYCGTQHTYLR